MFLIVTQSMARMDTLLQPVLDRVLDNRAHWTKLDEQRLVKTMNPVLQETDV